MFPFARASHFWLPMFDPQPAAQSPFFGSPTERTLRIWFIVLPVVSKGESGSGSFLGGPQLNKWMVP